MYIIICEIDCQSRFDAWDRVFRDGGTLGWPWGMGWEGRWEGGSGWVTHVYPWLIHVNVWQKPPQYCKVICLQLKLKIIITLEKKKKPKLVTWYSLKCSSASSYPSSMKFIKPLNYFRVIILHLLFGDICIFNNNIIYKNSC